MDLIPVLSLFLRSRYAAVCTMRLVRIGLVGGMTLSFDRMHSHWQIVTDIDPGYLGILTSLNYIRWSSKRTYPTALLQLLE
jgi:hypothetical protein